MEEMDLDEVYYDINSIEPYIILEYALEHNISWYGILHPAKNSISTNKTRKRQREVSPQRVSKRQRVL
jgi:hypothetical protein